MKNDFTATSPQRYKYNGKELDRMHGLDLYDYGARLYDSPLGRWHVMDPLCENYYSVSPYVYCMNNPVKFVDPNGKFAQKWAAELARFFYAKLHPNSSVSEVVTNNDASSRNNKFTFNSVRTENDELVITSHSRLSKSTVNVIQNTGIFLSVLGYSLTLTVVGAEYGINIAKVGNEISQFGSFCELGIDFINGDMPELITDGVLAGINFCLNNKLKKVFPTNIDSGIEDNVGNSIVRQGASIKEIIMERTVKEIIKDENKK